MAGSIEERDLLTRDLDLVGADLLGNAARFARRDVFLADPVHERRLAVVDVTEERDDRSAGLKSLGSVVRYEIVGVDSLQNRLRRRLVAGVLDSNLEAILLGDLRGDIGFDALVDRGENLKRHQIGDKTVRLDVELRGKILYDDGAADGNLARFLVDAYAPAGLGGRSGNAGNALIERALGVAALLVLAAAAAVIVIVIDVDGFRRTGLRLSGDGDLNGGSRCRMLKRLKARSGKTDLGDHLGSLDRIDGNFRFNPGRHTDNRLLGRGGNGNLRSGGSDLYGLGRLRRVDDIRLGFLLRDLLLNLLDLDRFCGSERRKTDDLTLCGGLGRRKMGGKTVPVGIDGFLAHFSGPGALCRADRLDIGALAQTGDGLLKRSEIAGIDRTDRACNLRSAAFGGPENIGAGNARLFS